MKGKEEDKCCIMSRKRMPEQEKQRERPAASLTPHETNRNIYLENSFYRPLHNLLV